MLTVPPEICGIICQDPSLGRSDLVALCKVSKSFRGEAERSLYSAICIQNPRLVKSWCTTLVKRPHLSPRVKQLHLVLPPSNDMELSFHKVLTQALGACYNLKNLGVFSHSELQQGNSVQAWIITGHSFRLLHFSNTYFHAVYLGSFFRGQPEIQVVYMPLHQSFMYRAPTFPNLATITISASLLLSPLLTQDLGVFRSLVFLRCALCNGHQEEMEFLEFLRKFELPKLARLSLLRTTGPAFTHCEFVLRLTQLVPALYSLQVSDRPGLEYITPSHVLLHFVPTLHTLIIEPSWRLGILDDLNVIYYTIAYFPYLRYLVLRLHGNVHVHGPLMTVNPWPPLYSENVQYDDILWRSG